MSSTYEINEDTGLIRINSKLRKTTWLDPQHIVALTQQQNLIQIHLVTGSSISLTFGPDVIDGAFNFLSKEFTRYRK